MSKLDREIKAIIDDMVEQAQELVPKLLVIMADEELSEAEQMAKLETLMKEMAPKSYDVYIADLKQVFAEAGWKAPDAVSSTDSQTNTKPKSELVHPDLLTREGEV